VLSADKKSQIQALDGTEPRLPLKLCKGDTIAAYCRIENEAADDRRTKANQD
jgi:hypothetical protein